MQPEAGRSAERRSLRIARSLDRLAFTFENDEGAYALKFNVCDSIFSNI